MWQNVQNVTKIPKCVLASLGQPVPESNQKLNLGDISHILSHAMPHYLWHESHFRLRARRRHLLEVRRDTKKCKQVRRSMSTTLLLLLVSVSFSSLLVVAAPNRSTQEEDLIGHEKDDQEGGLIGPVKDESELISAATTCQTAILRFVHDITDMIQFINHSLGLLRKKQIYQ